MSNYSILFLVIVFNLINLVSAQSFEKVNSKNLSYPTEDINFYKGSFFDNGKGWCIEGLSKTGTIYYTADNGATWTVQVELSTNCKFFDICFIDDQNGWIIGKVFDQNSNFILCTTDGGIHWKKYEINKRSMAICFVDRNTGFMGGDTLYSTINGGETWIPATVDSMEIIADIAYISFFNPSIGYFVGYTKMMGSAIFATYDGGKNWKCLSSFGYTMTSVTMPDSTHIVLAGSNSKSRGYCAVSENKGATWKFKALDAPTLFDIDLSDNIHGWAVATGHSPTTSIDTSILLQTNDCGSNWKTAYGYAGWLNSICFTPSKKTGFVLGSKNLLLRFSTIDTSLAIPVIENSLKKKSPLNKRYFIANRIDFTKQNNTGNQYITTNGKLITTCNQVSNGLYIGKVNQKQK